MTHWVGWLNLGAAVFAFGAFAYILPIAVRAYRELQDFGLLILHLVLAGCNLMLAGANLVIMRGYLR